MLLVHWNKRYSNRYFILCLPSYDMIKCNPKLKFGNSYLCIVLVDLADFVQKYVSYLLDSGLSC